MSSTNFFSFVSRLEQCKKKTRYSIFILLNSLVNYQQRLLILKYNTQDYLIVVCRNLVPTWFNFHT